ncbi:MAG TPA: hypothetical protein VG816_00975 [Solirubrobacterales bacterium]|nr:hypothetical protein [Solirubrobacterales bacterium]
MRSIRMIGLAALAAAAALATIGAGTASAAEGTVFCKVNVEVCKGTNVSGYAFTSQPTTEAKFDFGEAGKTQCTSQMIRGSEERINTLSFSSCSEGCTVTANGLGAWANLVEPIAGNGKMSVTLGSFKIKCGTAECAYNGTLTNLPVEGGNPAVVHVNKTLPEEGGSILCPDSVKWEADYKFKTPAEAVYVTVRGAEGPLFCGVNEAPCPQASLKLFNEFPLATGTQMVFGKVPGGSNVTCNSGGFALNDFEPYVANGNWSYKPWGYSSCTSSVYTECSFNLPNAPLRGKLTPSGAGNGSVTVSEWENGIPTVTQSCSSKGTPFTCVYTTSSFTLKVTGGKPASLSTTISLTRQSGSLTLCSATTTLTASYEPSGGGALYLLSS